MPKAINKMKRKRTDLEEVQPVCEMDIHDYLNEWRKTLRHIIKICRYLLLKIVPRKSNKKVSNSKKKKTPHISHNREVTISSTMFQLTLQ